MGRDAASSSCASATARRVASGPFRHQPRAWLACCMQFCFRVCCSGLGARGLGVVWCRARWGCIVWSARACWDPGGALYSK